MIFFLIPLSLFAQRLPTYQNHTFIGVNLAPLLMNTVDLRFEPQIGRYLALQTAAGFRIQGRESNNRSTFSILEDYIGLKSRGAFLSIGGRVFDNSAWEYPYFAIDIAGVYYNEKFEDNFNSNGIPQDTLHINGFTFGATATLGFVIRIAKRMKLDLALQAGYSPFREEDPSYYLPGVGFSTFGAVDRLSAKGLMFQPVVLLKYDLVKDKRDRIREME